MSVQQWAQSAAAWAGVQPKAAAGRLVHAFIGAVFGIFLTGLVMRLWSGSAWAGGGTVTVPLLVAPIGASAVLLFGVPASPLAQPWAIIGGNTVSALCGIFWAHVIADPAYASGLAVATAIVMMGLLRCMHPPGGAVALTGVIGGPTVVAAGWSFAFMPVALNCLLLVAVGWLYNAVSRGNYPHHAKRYAPAAVERVGYTLADLETVLAQYDELLDVSSEDLDTLFRQIESRAYGRLHGVIRCTQIMRRDVPVLTPEAGLDEVRALLAVYRGSLPVAGADGRVVGILSAGRLALQEPTATVARAMDPSPCTASPDTAIDELLPLLSSGVHQVAVVIDERGRVLGMIDQTDLIAALWRGHIAEEIARGTAP